MYYVNPNIKNLYRTSYSESRKGYIRLDMNENPEGLPQWFFNEVMQSITTEDIAMYPEMNPLLERIAEYLDCHLDNICITNGSDDAIRLLFEIFGETGKKVVSVNPSFEMYSVYSNMYGLVHTKVTYDENFEIPLDKLLNSIDNETSIVVLLNPNSPVGRSWTESEIKVIIEKAKENNAIVVIDEAYYYFSTKTFLNLIYNYDNLMVFRTFSKMLSIAGCRIGYIVSNKQIISMVKNASSTYPVNCFAIKFAEKLLDNPQIIKELTIKEKIGRDYLLNELKIMGYEYHYNNGNYVLIKCKKHPEQIFNELKERNILIKTYKQPILSEWIRVTTGSIETMMFFWEQFKVLDKA